MAYFDKAKTNQDDFFNAARVKDPTGMAIQDAQKQLQPQQGFLGKIKSFLSKPIESKSPYVSENSGINATLTSPTLPYGEESNSLKKSVLKAVVNVPTSTIRFAEGLLNPKTYVNIGKALAGGVQSIPGIDKFYDSLASAKGKEQLDKNRDAFHGFVDTLENQYGSWENIKRSIAEDPVGTAFLVRGAMEGAAGVARKAGATELAGKLGRAGELALPVEKIPNVVSAGAKLAGKVTGFTASQLTGLAPETLSQIVRNPDAFGPEAKTALTRGSLAEDIHGTLKSRLDELSATGKEYGSIRENKTPIPVPKDMVPSILKKYGLSLDKEGRIVTTAESVPLKPGDIRELQGFLDQYGKEKVLNGNSLLNTRQAADSLADWGVDKSDVAGRIGRDLRFAYDGIAKSKIPGLESLDAKFAPEVKELTRLKSEYLNPDGTLKDTALNRIANITGKGKDLALARLEKLSPGISEKVNILKAIEDLSVSGNKVGHYTKAAGVGLATGGVPGAIIGMILSSPDVIVPILRRFGKLAGGVDEILSKLKSGGTLTPAEKAGIQGALDEFTHFTEGEGLLREESGLPKQLPK